MWVIENIKETQLSEYLEDIVDIASENGNINVLNVLYNLHIKNKFEFKYTENAIDNACFKGHNDVVEWFYNHNHYLENELEFKYTEDAIDWACESGNINIVEWFYNHRDEIEFKYTSDAIDNAAEHKHMNIIEWFYNHKNEFKFKYTKDAVDTAFENKHYKVVKWFHDHRDEYKFKFTSTLRLNCYMVSVNGFKLNDFTKCINVLEWINTYEKEYLPIRYKDLLSLYPNLGNYRTINSNMSSEPLTQLTLY